MSQIREIADKFFDECETGKGWESCKNYCNEDASFSCHSYNLAEVKTVQEYSDWMTGICEIMPDSKYDIKSVTMDEDRGHVSYFAVFSGTHIGEGGPVPPTNKWGEVDYVYVLEFQNNKISHLTKIFNPHYINKQIGWE